MTSLITWQDAYKSGVKHLHRDNYDQALRAFDTAYKLGAPGPRVVPSRSNVLRSVQELDEASKTEPKKDPKEDAPRLFARLARLPVRIRNTILRPSLRATASTASRVEANLQTLLSSVRDSTPTRNFIARLPVEILAHIGRYVVADDRPPGSEIITLPLRLTALCQRWRAVFRGDPLFWAAIAENIADPNVPLTCRVRSIGDGGDDLGWEVRPRHWPGTETGARENAQLLELLASVRNGGAIKTEWTPHEPYIRGLGPARESDQLIALAAWEVVSQLRRTLKPSFFGQLRSITHLAIEDFHPINNASIYPLLHQERMPNLASLHLEDRDVTFAHPDATPSDPSVIYLPNLTRLEVHECNGYPDPHGRHKETAVFILPNLNRFLTRDYSTESIPFPPLPYRPNTSYLQNLCLADIQGPHMAEIESRFIGRLPLLPNLHTLDISAGEWTDAILDALNWPKRGEKRTGPCPSLASLTLFANVLMTGEAVKRLVVSRVRGSERGRVRGECQKLTYLDIEYIEGGEEKGISAEIGAFLEARVGTLHCTPYEESEQEDEGEHGTSATTDDQEAVEGSLTLH